MSARDLIQEALHSLEANKGRSLLTILGIVIGIASVIAMTSLIGGIQNSLVNSLGLNAARMVQIYSSQELTESDIEKLQNHKDSAAPDRNRYCLSPAYIP